MRISTTKIVIDMLTERANFLRDITDDYAVRYRQNPKTLPDYAMAMENELETRRALDDFNENANRPVKATAETEAKEQ